MKKARKKRDKMNITHKKSKNGSKKNKKRGLFPIISDETDLITIEEYKKTPDLFPILSGENSVECRPLLMLRKFISNHFERGLASFFVSRSIYKVRFPSSRMRKRNRD
ncbi:hypothetical protein IX307_000100 [Bacteroides pyogenes]|uniref:Uncharacterized protein n=2 Tax=Bacteroides pyogenes TaxID=310300 RepID=W4PJR7_9BACE|nr:hypothetical protein [Bacteroides pyogenes]GAE16548.1 hypothetical protein JCM6292_2994 [Bacteroides pyogenes JCM 6292]GAE19935.1 hypothetical protein JCM6294_3055 [Bacteroides pyogenes DSM 20611 = JCM 6294]MBR8717430.1 hypothetical protein [Bacteroides pyogenes]MBR8718983.1 hypothetical protein [Bacteroides pyogenes]